MTLAFGDVALYAGALLILFITPGPVWIGVIARALSGGLRSVWPLALGVGVGDVIWSLVAILGVSWIGSAYAGSMITLRYFASGVFVIMGLLLIKHAAQKIDTDSRLTRLGMWAGFVAGLAVILGNPKAVLFYMGVLPGFFNLTTLHLADIIVICSVSFLVPLVGNLTMGILVDRVRRFLVSGESLRRTNIVAGILLICVGLIIPFL